MTKKTLDELAVNLNVEIPNSGNFAVLVLLQQTLATSVVFTADSPTDVLTATGHGMINYAIIRFTQVGTLPAPIAANVDYWIFAVTANTFKIAASLASAIATTSLDLTTNGSGSNTFTEQPITEARFELNQYDKSFLIGKELAHVNYVRYQYASPGASVQDTGALLVYKPTQTSTITVNIANPALTFQFALLLRGGTTTLLNTTGTLYQLKDYGSSQSVSPGTTFDIPITLQSKNA